MSSPRNVEIMSKPAAADFRRFHVVSSSSSALFSSSSPSAVPLPSRTFEPFRALTTCGRNTALASSGPPAAASTASASSTDSSHSSNRIFRNRSGTIRGTNGRRVFPSKPASAKTVQNSLASNATCSFSVSSVAAIMYSIRFGRLFDALILDGASSVRWFKPTQTTRRTDGSGWAASANNAAIYRSSTPTTSKNPDWLYSA